MKTSWFCSPCAALRQAIASTLFSTLFVGSTLLHGQSGVYSVNIVGVLSVEPQPSENADLLRLKLDFEPSTTSRVFLEELSELDTPPGAGTVFSLIDPDLSGAVFSTDYIIDKRRDDGRGFFRAISSAPVIDAVEGNVLSSTSTGSFTILGSGFETGDDVLINGVSATGVNVNDTNTINVTTGAGLSVGLQTVTVVDNTGATKVELPGGVTVTPSGISNQLPPEAAPLASGSCSHCFHPAATDSGAKTATAVTQDQVTVDPATGALIVRSVDLVIPGVGFDFTIERTYRSKGGVVGVTYPLVADYDKTIAYNYQVLAGKYNDLIVVNDGNGRAYAYHDDGTGTYTAPGLFREGTLDVPSDTFSLRHANGIIWEFNPFNAAVAPGKIASVTDRNGNEMTFAYDVQGRLDTVTDTLGRDIAFTYDAQNRISTITDFDGRTLTYGYDANGNLASVTSPAVTGTSTGNDFPSGRTVTYGYTSGQAVPELDNLLETITDAKGQTWLTNTYTTATDPNDFFFNRVLLQQIGDPLDSLNDVITYRYEDLTPGSPNNYADSRCTINDRRGNVTRITCNSNHLMILEEQFTGQATPGDFVFDPSTLSASKLRPSDPDSYVTAYEYNIDYLPTTITGPRGDILELTYERDLNYHCEPEERGNVRQTKSTAAPGKTTDNPVVTERFLYRQDFGRMERSLSVHWDVVPPRIAPPRIARPRIAPPRASAGQASVHWAAIWLVTRSDIYRTTANDTATVHSSSSGAIDPLNSATNGRNRTDSDSYQRLGMPLVNEAVIGVSVKDRFIVRHTDARGYVTTFDYDANANLTAINPPVEGTGPSFEYDSSGRMTAMVHPDNGSGHQRRDEYTYHASGNGIGLLDTVTVDADVLSVGHTGAKLSTTYGYNAVGDVTSVTDPLGGVLNIERNALSEGITMNYTAVNWSYMEQRLYDANGNVTQVDVTNYDETGALVASNPQFTTTFTYDTLDRITSVSEEVDPVTTRTTQYEYDANGNVARVLSPEAVAGNDTFNTVNFFYDERDLLLRETYAPGDATEQASNEYAYDENGALTTVTDAANSGAPRTWTVANDGQLYIAVGGGGVKSVFPRRGPPSRGDLRVKSSFPRRGPPSGSQIQSMSHSDHFIPQGISAASIIDRRKFLSQLFQSQDLFENLIAGNKSGFDSVTTVIPSEFAKPVSSIDPMGNVTEYDYDAVGNLKAARTSGEIDDQPGDANNVLLSDVRFTYDGNGRLLSEAVQVFDPSTGSPLGDGQNVSTFSYTPSGAVATATDDNGNVTTYAYDSVGRTSTVTATSDTDGVPAQTSFSYLPNGLLETVSKRDGHSILIYGLDLTYGYDGAGNVTSITDSAGNATTYAYDSRGNVVEVTDPRGTETRTVYDALSRPLFIYTDMDADGADGDGDDLVVSYTYDLNDRPTGSTDAEGNTTTYAYDSLDRQTQVTLAVNVNQYSRTFQDRSIVYKTSTDPNGTVMDYTYDSLLRLTRVDITPGPGVDGQAGTLLYSYDGLGRTVSAEKRDGGGNTVATNTMTYSSNTIGFYSPHTEEKISTCSRGSGGDRSDDQGWGANDLLSETQQVTVPTPGGGTTTVINTVQYTRDEMGLLTSMTYPDGEIISYTYDGLNRVDAVSSSLDGELVNYDYIGFGLVGQATYGNGTVQTFTYNGDINRANTPGDFGFGQISSQTLTRTSDGETLYSASYLYDENGNTTSQAWFTRKEDGSGVRSVSESYAYDAANRLDAYFKSVDGFSTLDEFLTLEDAGLRDQVTGTNHAGGFSIIGSYTNTGDDDLRNRYTSSPFGTYAYDANGNRTSLNDGLGTIEGYTFDALDNLVGYTDGTSSYLYAYDALGRRVLKVDATAPASPVVDLFVYAGDSEIREVNDVSGATPAAKNRSSAPRGKHMIAITLEICRVAAPVGTSGPLVFLTGDALGHMKLATDAATGATLESYDYHAFGMPSFFDANGATISGTTLSNDHLFGGMRWDTESEVYSKSSLLRWVQKDGEYLMADDWQLCEVGDLSGKYSYDPKTGTGLGGGEPVTNPSSTGKGTWGKETWTYRNGSVYQGSVSSF